MTRKTPYHVSRVIRTGMLLLCASLGLACAKGTSKKTDMSSAQAEGGTGSHPWMPNPGDDAAMADPKDGDTDEAGPGIGIQTLTQACAGSSVQVMVLDDETVRVRFVRNAQDRGWLYDLKGFSGPSSFALDRQDADGLTLHTKSVELDLDGSCKLHLRDRTGRVLWDTTAGAYGERGQGASITRSLASGERIYGLGEKGGAADRRGRRLTNWNSDPAWLPPTKRYTPSTDPLYQSHPFFLSIADGQASGVYLANSYRSVFDLGATKSDQLSIEVDGGEIDLFVFAGPSPARVVERYTKLVGRTPLPPMWSLGYHQARWSYTPDTRVKEIAAELRKRKLPADGIWLDIDYMRGYRDFTFDPNTFADPKGLISGLNDQGFKVTAILDPGVKSDPNTGYAAYDLGVAMDAFIKGTDKSLVLRKCWPDFAAFPDYSAPRGRAYWASQVAELHRTSGLNGTWIDMNEPAVFHEEGFPLDAPVDGDGHATTFAELRNIYASLMARATYEGALMARPDMRPFILTRAGFSGVQKYAAVWTGDAESEWETLAMVPAQLVGMSLSGVAQVGSDVGGFTGAKSPEMYGRWFELGAFSPFFRSHVMKERDNKPTPDQEPWSFGTDIETAARNLLELRYRLLPYWMQQFAAHAESGAPVLRPLWWDAPSDAESHKHDDEFFVGPSLLVAPVTSAGAKTRQLYLPQGTFVDFYTGERREGGQSIEVAAPIGRVPLFVRAGSIIPMQLPRQYVGEKVEPTLFLDVYAGAEGTEGSLSLYEDDGESLAYQRGSSARTAVAMRVTKSGTEVDLGARMGSFTPEPRNIVVRLHGIASAPNTVTVDGATAKASFDEASHTAEVSFSDDGKAHEIKLDHTLDAAMGRSVEVQVSVTLPANTPDGMIYIATSANSWKPDGVALTRSGNTASGTMMLSAGTSADFKLTRGSWATVEKDASCKELTNRKISVPSTQTDPLMVTATVATWSDLCGK